MSCHDYPTLALLIGGKWISGTSAGSQTVRNPLDGSALGELPHAGISELDLALVTADEAFGPWQRTSPVERGRILHRAAGLIRERLERIARTLTREQGKPLRESRAEVMVAADYIDWFAEEGRRAYGRLVPPRLPTVTQAVTMEPVGPVACFSPWNFPAITPARKVGAALAAGCTCIIKPAEETPGTMVEIAAAFQDAGLPDGVLSLVFGVPAQISEHLIQSPIIRKISFTGSTIVGRHLAALSGQHLKKATLELGGHAPVIVCADYDPVAAARAVMPGKLRNSGQVCVAPTRFFVERPVYDRFVEATAEIFGSQTFGDGLDDSVTLGPLANERRIAALEDLIADAVERGARLVCGGRRPDKERLFFEPTLLTDVPDDAKVMVTEPFGPIALVQPFDNLKDAIASANALPYGLAAYAFTNSSRAAHQISTGVRAGTIGINHLAITSPETPFGGVDDSGYGLEGGMEGLDAYMNKKFVTTMHDPHI